MVKFTHKIKQLHEDQAAVGQMLGTGVLFLCAHGLDIQAYNGAVLAVVMGIEDTHLVKGPTQIN